MAQQGDIIDRYRLDKWLGSGASGEVWKASHLADGSDVGFTCAVKLMRLAQERTGSTPKIAATGWIDEVRNLIKVAGDTIPRIFDANVWSDYAYIAMEHLEGMTLRARIDDAAIPWRRALYIAAQIAKPLEAAHKEGLVHRDLKPNNVILELSDRKRVCVIDWGIARLKMRTMAATASGVTRLPGTDVTSTDREPIKPIDAPRSQASPVGTPGYMAPELYDDPTTSAPEQDVYALGVVLYEMIAKRLPHAVRPLDDPRSSESTRAYRNKLDKATMDYALVPLRERCPEVPKAVAELVDSMLARNPERRPRNLREAFEHANRFPAGIPASPYAGLARMGPEYAGLYFGQDEGIELVLERFRSQRAVVLWGPSGTGKSSLALAGVAATMDRTLFLDKDGWEVHVIRPRDGQRLSIAADIKLAAPTGIGHLVVIDQLEEVVDLETSDRQIFCAALLALLGGTTAMRVGGTNLAAPDEVRLIVTIRSDQEWRVQQEVPALRSLLDCRLIVSGVDPNFVRSIVEEPALVCGYSVAGTDVVRRDVEDRLSQSASKLPIVQYALNEWWERRDVATRTLSTAAWKALGGVDGALSSVAERFYSSLRDGQDQRVKALFVQLFQRDRKQPLAESALTPEDRLLMEELARLRLVARRDKEDAAPFYEVEHEYLSKNWPRLAAWLAEAREDQALASELERDATAYAADHDPERLWRGGRLVVVTDMIKRGRFVPAPTATAREFVHQARRRERRGVILRSLLIGVIVTVILGAIFAFVVYIAARDARDEARREAVLAGADRKEAQESRDAADVSRKAADEHERQAAERLRNATVKSEEADQKEKEADRKVKDLDRTRATLRAELTTVKDNCEAQDEAWRRYCDTVQKKWQQAEEKQHAAERAAAKDEKVANAKIKELEAQIQACQR